MNIKRGGIFLPPLLKLDNMYVSNYTFLFTNNKEYYIFNTLTKCLLQIDHNVYAYLKQSQLKDLPINQSEIQDDLLSILRDKHIICDDHKREIELCKSIIRQTRQVESFCHITIAPTMDCCFSCYYCFEKEKRQSYMTDDTIDAICKYLLKNPNMQSLHITWFGGEPLMAIKQIKAFWTKFKPFYKGNFSSDIITTAFHINRDVIVALKDVEISEMQITLDGTEKTHNKIKRIENCSNVFEKIISNIDMIVQLYPQLNISIRVNLTKSNFIEYIELYRLLSNRYKNNRVSVIPGYIVNRNNMHRCDLFNHDERAKFAIDLWNLEKIPTPWIMYNPDITECAIRNINSIVIDPDGYVYKCWEKIGETASRYGFIDKHGDIQILKKSVLTQALYGADPLEDEHCERCPYLPLCFGGCPMQRIDNHKQIKNNDLCTSYKNHIKEWLCAYIELKKSQHRL